MILYCKCAGSDFVTTGAKEKISIFLEESDLEYAEVADFCDLVANSAALIKEQISSSSLSVIACYPRTIEWLLHASGICAKELNLTYYNMREQKPDDILSFLNKDASLKKGSRIEIANG